MSGTEYSDADLLMFASDNARHGVRATLDQTQALLRLLDAERAKVARVEAFANRLKADGYSACIYESAAEVGDILDAILTSSEYRP